MRRLISSPKSDGFYMPAEFEEHRGCFLVWPERSDNWRLGAKPAQAVFAQFINSLQQYEQVYVGVSQNQFENARSQLDDGVIVFEMSSDDAWARDTGPTFVKNNQGVIRGIDWNFNAWGGFVDGLYFPWNKDKLVAQKLCEVLKVDTYDFNHFVLEGGSIHVDGEGTLITTRACLLSEGRNPDLTDYQIENILKDALGVTKVIWLEHGIYLDETNEHVDNILHYVGPAEVVLAWTDNEEDPQYDYSQKAYEVLKNSVDAKGRNFIIHKLKVPEPILITKEESEGVDVIAGTLPRNEGDRQAASYANFYIANKAVFVPQFGDENDQKAIEMIQQIFSEREIIGIPSREILLGGGNLHCITQQIPK